MNIKDYHKKINDLLDPEKYKKLQQDPMSKTMRIVSRLIRSSTIDDSTKKVLCRSEAKTLRLYGLPKIQKPMQRRFNF